MTTPPAPPPVVTLSMTQQFRKFLLETNAIALAVAVILGGAAAKLVSAIVDGIIMPIISLVMPGGDWRTARIILKEGVIGPDGTVVGETAIQAGLILAATLDFVIVAAVVFFVAVKVLKIEVKR